MSLKYEPATVWWVAEAVSVPPLFWGFWFVAWDLWLVVCGLGFRVGG